MQIIKDKEYDFEKENKSLNFVSFNSNKTLSLVMKDGTHYNFCREELKMILDFVENILMGVKK